jgi:hypothetical protein
MHAISSLMGYALPAIPGHLPDHALCPEFTVELWIKTLAATVEIQAFATISAVAGLVFLTDGRRFPVRMVSAFHETNLSN